MSIGIYNPYLDTMSGGEKYILTLASCLVKKHQVTLFWDPKEKDSIVKKARNRFGIDLTSLEFSDKLFVKKMSPLARLRNSKAYDLVIVLSDGSIPTLLCPLILHFQSPLEWVNGKSVKNRIKMSRVKTVICNSQFTKSYIDRTFGIESDVLYPPVVLSKKENSKKENIILHVGRFGIQQGGSSYKKQEVMAQAFKEMVDEGFDNWELVFVMSVKENEMEKVQEFKDSIKNYPLRVVINPVNDALWDLYTKATFYWHASGFGEDLQNHPDRAEHFGISTVEAMGMGAVPITYKAGGQPEIVEDGENGFLWTDTKELKERTKSLVEDTLMREKMSKQAEITAKTFSMEKFCQRVEELIT